MKDKSPAQVRLEAQEIRKKLLREKGACENCGREENLVLHHITQPEDGGTNDPENLVLLCRSCESHFHAMGGKPPEPPFETVGKIQFITGVSKGGAITIPKPKREEIELSSGDFVRVRLEKLKGGEEE